MYSSRAVRRREWVASGRAQSNAHLISDVQAVVVALAVVVITMLATAPTPAAGQTTYDLTGLWDDVPATPEAAAVPRGCSCVSAESPCPEFYCSCVCDLTAGSCDANCCCDSECTATETARFEAAESCLPEGPLPSTIKFCADVSKESLFGAINPKFRMIKEAQDNIVDDLMCVVVDNNPSRGSFFADPGTPDVSLLDASTAPSFETAARTTTTSTATFYEVGDDVGAALDDSGTLVSTGGGKLFVPRVGDSGLCFDSFAVPFAEKVASSTCTRVLSGTVAARCSSLDVADYASNLRVAKAPNSQVGDSSLYVQVTTSSVQLRDAAGSVGAHPNTGALSATLLNDRSWCYNALLKADYTITHDGSGHVTAASVALLLGNVTVGGDFATISQSFSVTWVSSASVTTSFANGNIVARPKSGNPGYVVGLPVLAGTVETDAGTSKQAISMWTDGLMLNDCTGTPSVVVGYGQSMTFGCSVTVTKAELETMCQTQSQLSKFGFNPTHVGAFGNADPLNTAEWVEVSKVTSLTQTWQTATASCTGMATGLTVEFLTANVGEAGNPQRKILVARSKYATDTWTYSSRSGSQTFIFTTTVSFVSKSQADTSEYVPPGPPLLPELPNDLFYPFTLSSSSNAGSVARASTLATMLMAMVVGVVVSGRWF